MIKRGEIFLANLMNTTGSEQSGIRPVLIVQNDFGNKYSPTVIVLPITSKVFKTKLPTHVPIQKKELYGLKKDSIILVEQVRTIDKSRLIKKIGSLDDAIMEKVKNALKVNFNIRAKFNDIFYDW